MKTKFFLFIISLIVIIGIYSCEKDIIIKDSIIFFEDFSDLNRSTKIWELKGLAKIDTDDSSNYYISVTSHTEKGMGYYFNSNAGIAYCSITGIEYDQLIYELSFKTFIEFDDGPTSIRLSQIKKDTTLEILVIYECYTNGWENYNVIDTIFDIRIDDTLKITIQNMPGFYSGTNISKFDSIKLVSK